MRCATFGNYNQFWLWSAHAVYCDLPPLMPHWPTIINCPGQIVIVTDALASPGDFILHDLVGDCARVQDAFCVLVSLDETFDHWKIIGSRLVSTAQLEEKVSSGMTHVAAMLAESTSELTERTSQWSTGLHQQSAANRRHRFG